jgi:peptide/nickel transport system substrate-binding protein
MLKMTMITRSRLATSALFLSAALLFPGSPVFAQDATFVLPSGDAGAPSYDPIRGTNLNAATTLIYDRMVIQDADQTIHGQLATSWEAAPDGMSWTFKLRPNVKFHDGEPFNAKTIAWWVPKFVGTENAFMTAAIDKVEIIDDLTVKFVMKNPDPNMLFNMASSFMGIPSPKAYDAAGDKYGVASAVGTGPFKLVSFTVGQQTVLERNDGYNSASDLSANQGPAKIKNLTIREIPEASTAFLEMKTGGVDMLMSVPTDFLPQLAAEPGMKVITIPGADVFYMPINTQSPPFTDLKVREAAALAVNQKEILANIFGGVGAEAHTFLISSLAESKVDPKLEISFNPDKAKMLLDEAGWKAGADGMREKDGVKLATKLWTENGTEYKKVTEVIQAQLKAIGMQADITVFDSATIKDQYRKKTDHQLAVRSYSWGNADIIDWFFAGSRLGYPNISMFNDPKAEELNAKAMKASKTWDERVANFKSYHEYILGQFTFAPIYQPVQNIAYSDARLTVPKLRGTRLQSQTVVDIEVK